MIRISRPILIAIAGFCLGLAFVVVVRLARRDVPPPRPAPAMASSPPAPGPPDPRYVYRVEVDQAPLRGPADALVTIVAFSSYECARCREVEDAIRRLAEADPVGIRIAWKGLPVSADRKLGALGALAAARQDRFWELHDRLMRAEARLDAAAVLREAESAGLDVAGFRAALADPALEESLRADEQQAVRFGLKTPPAIFVNGKLVPDPTFDALSRSVEEARAFAERLVTEGTPADRVYAALMRGALTDTGPIGAMPGAEDLVEHLK